MLACNCYVLAPRQGADAIVVDPGQRAMAPLRRVLDENRLTPAAVLLTHGHIDHIWSAQKVSDTYGCPTYIHPADRFMLTDPLRSLGTLPGQALVGALSKMMFSEPKQLVELDGDTQTIGLAETTVIVEPTPGHTRGSVVFRVHGVDRFMNGVAADLPAAGVVFTGDTLFKNSVGRTDLPGGSGRDLMHSLVGKLLTLEDATVVLPGHGPTTTIGAERRHNPFLEGLTA